MVVSGDPLMDVWILWARDEMERRLHDPRVIEHLAATMDVSLSRFTRLFAEREGIAPDRYLHRLRLERAKLLLERTFLSIEQVIALVGLSDAKRFEADFIRAYGVLPTTLRDQVWGGSTRRG
jgi:transcriptional regulator GlxA family with amidase domain